MSIAPTEELIDGLTYCNLRSTFPYQFVDRKGVPVGNPLSAVSQSTANKLEMYPVYREVPDVYAVTSGLKYVQGMKHYIKELRMGPDLRQHIEHCQRKTRINVIVVDSDVMDAAIKERIPHDKFFMPMIQDPSRRRFFKYGVAELVESNVKAEHIILHPASWKLKPPPFN